MTSSSARSSSPARSCGSGGSKPIDSWRRSTSDSGTPRSDDDYGYDGLKHVLETQLPRVKSLRYDIEYRNIRVTGDQAEVEVFLDGAFEISAPEAGDRYRRVNDYHRFLLAREGDEWKFLGGM